MTASFTRDIFQPDTAFVIEESASEVDGKHVLAKVRGTFFVPEGASRNNRFYPKSLWEKALSDPNVKSKLTEKRMLGTIGHEQIINDSALLEGKVSHVITNLAIQGTKGVGEALILNTPAGQVLNTLLRAGSKMFVSSRANGTFKGESATGLPVVDPETYALDTFDFVTDPGFLEANPSLIESLNNLYNEQPKIGEKRMSTELLERLSKENVTIREDFTKAVAGLDEAKKTVAVLEDRNKTLTEASAKMEKELTEAKKALNEFKARAKDTKELDRVFDLTEKNAKELKEWRKLGDVRTVSRALDKAHSALVSYSKLGTPAVVSEAMDKATSVISKYKKFGTLEQLNKCFTVFEGMKTKQKTDEANREVIRLSRQLGISEEKVKKVYGKLSAAEIKEVFAGSEKSDEVSRFRKAGASKPVEEKVLNVTEKTRTARLFESLG